MGEDGVDADGMVQAVRSRLSPSIPAHVEIQCFILSSLGYSAAMRESTISSVVAKEVTNRMAKRPSERGFSTLKAKFAESSASFSSVTTGKS